MATKVVRAVHREIRGTKAAKASKGDPKAAAVTPDKAEHVAKAPAAHVPAVKMKKTMI